MSYQEKRALASLLSTILITTLYAAYMMQRYPAAGLYSPEVFRFWGIFFLILVPVSIIGKIILYIGFSIVNTLVTQEPEPGVTDERDHLIEMRATRNSLYVFGLGFMGAMAVLAAEFPPALMFAILICAGVVSEMVSDISQFYLYRRGF